MRISDWSSDVCSSDLIAGVRPGVRDALFSAMNDERAFACLCRATATLFSLTCPTPRIAWAASATFAASAPLLLFRPVTSLSNTSPQQSSTLSRSHLLSFLYPNTSHLFPPSPSSLLRVLHVFFFS